jgi:hypothetical protein
VEVKEELQEVTHAHVRDYLLKDTKHVIRRKLPTNTSSKEERNNNINSLMASPSEVLAKESKFHN